MQVLPPENVQGKAGKGLKRSLQTSGDISSRAEIAVGVKACVLVSFLSMVTFVLLFSYTLCDTWTESERVKLNSLLDLAILLVIYMGWSFTICISCTYLL